MKIAALFWSFLRVGAGAFGGGMAALPVMERELAGRRGWMSPEEVRECFALAQAVPGVILVNFATEAGGRLMGRKGAVAAGVAVVLPAFLLVLALAGVFNTEQGRAWVGKVTVVLQLLVAGLLAWAAWRLAAGELARRKGGGRGWGWFAIAAGVAAGMAVWPGAGPLAWLLAGAAAGWLFLRGGEESEGEEGRET